MKFDVEIKGEKKEVEINMLGKHVKLVGKYLKEMVSNTDEESNDLSITDDYLDKIWKIVCDLTGLKPEDYDEMLEEDSKKLTDYVQNKWKDRLAFMSAL